MRQKTDGLIYVALIVIVIMGAVIVAQHAIITNPVHTKYIAWTDGAIEGTLDEVVSHDMLFTNGGSIEINPDSTIMGKKITHVTIVVENDPQ